MNTRVVHWNGAGGERRETILLERGFFVLTRQV